MLLHPAEVCTMLRESPPACIVATLDALLSSDRLTGFITDVSTEFAAVLYCLRDLHASSAAPDACLASLFDLYTHAGTDTRERQVVATLLQPLCAAANPDTVYELMWCFHGVTREHAANPPLVFLASFCRATIHRLCAVTFLEVAAVAHVVPILAELLRVHLFCRSAALGWMAGDVLWRPGRPECERRLLPHAHHVRRGGGAHGAHVRGRYSARHEGLLQAPHAGGVCDQGLMGTRATWSRRGRQGVGHKSVAVTRVCICNCVFCCPIKCHFIKPQSHKTAVP